MDISKRILNILDSKGMSKKNLADAMGIPPQNINSTVLNNPKFEVMERVAVALEMSLAELVGDEEKVELEPKQFVCPHCGKPIKIRIE